jgi:predicted ATP-dependent serine protease
MPVPHYSTGFPAIDDLMGEECPGIPRGALTLIVGPQMSGKTALARAVAHNVATHTSGRVLLVDSENRRDPSYHPYDINNDVASLRELGELIISEPRDLIIVEGVQDMEASDTEAIASRARELSSIVSRVRRRNQDLALVVTWNQRTTLPESIPAGVGYPSSLIIRLDNRGRLVMVSKNRFGDSGVSRVFESGFLEEARIPAPKPEPEFDRSKIPTRFEREDVI